MCIRDRTQHHLRRQPGGHGETAPIRDAVRSHGPAPLDLVPVNGFETILEIVRTILANVDAYNVDPSTLHRGRDINSSTRSATSNWAVRVRVSHPSLSEGNARTATTSRSLITTTTARSDEEFFVEVKVAFRSYLPVFDIFIARSSRMAGNQVVVIGGGLAGLSAAHTVLERGGTVVLLDKMAFLGTNATQGN
eukprot:7370849-Pyramimonas_sp.AAC.1